MKTITIETIIKSDIDTVWEYWTNPDHIIKWAFASDDWECPYAENDVQEGGKFLTRMAAKDGSEGFDIVGTYTEVIPKEKLAYTMEDGRTVAIGFNELETGEVQIVQEFEMESTNTEELQRNGWQSILDNFKKHVEQE